MLIDFKTVGELGWKLVYHHRLLTLFIFKVLFDLDEDVLYRLAISRWVFFCVCVCACVWVSATDVIFAPCVFWQECRGGGGKILQPRGLLQRGPVGDGLPHPPQADLPGHPVLPHGQPQTHVQVSELLPWWWWLQDICVVWMITLMGVKILVSVVFMLTDLWRIDLTMLHKRLCHPPRDSRGHFSLETAAPKTEGSLRFAVCTNDCSGEITTFSTDRWLHSLLCAVKDI